MTKWGSHDMSGEEDYNVRFGRGYGRRKDQEYTEEIKQLLYETKWKHW